MTLDPTRALPAGRSRLELWLRGGVRPASQAKSTLRVGLLVAVLVLAVCIRLWLAFGRLGGGLDSDEAVTGLIARRMLHQREFPAFYWGQAYGGNLDALLLVPPMWLFGSTTTVLKLYYLCSGAIVCLLTWRVARHLIPAEQAIVAGVLSAVWPLAQTLKTTRVNAFYSTTTVIGLAAWLVVLHIDEQPRRKALWIASGALVGLGWWVSPNIVYFALPLALWLVVRGHWKRWLEILLALGAFILGSWVWIVANLRSDFASLDVPDWSGSSTWWSRLGFLFTDGLPFAFGLRRPWYGDWLLGRPLSSIAYVALLAGIGFAFWRSQAGKRSDFLVLAMAPIVFATFPANWILHDGRYLFFIAAVLPITLARLWTALVLRLALSLVVVACGLAFVANADRMEEPHRKSTGPMIEALRVEGVSTAVADYWIAYKMTFEADERIIASPLDTIRFQPYSATVRSTTDTTAFVFWRDQPPSDYAWVNDNLDALRISYRVVVAGDLVAIVPDEHWVP
jgi:hypothetical protein